MTDPSAASPPSSAPAQRCWWAGPSEDYLRYHDTEWGIPVINDQRLFEKICLEGFQAGLSWLTILRKRDNFRRAFLDFDHEQVARFTSRSVDRLLKDPGIVRHRGKIEAAINNAKRARELVQECGSLGTYLWRYEPAPESRPHSLTEARLRRMTMVPESFALSRDLKRRGWKFVGPTTMYAFMQAMGLVNDHVEGCIARPKAAQARAQLQIP